MTLGFLCAARSRFAAGADWPEEADAEEPFPCCEADGLEVGVAAEGAVASVAARPSAGACESAGAVARAGSTLSAEPASARGDATASPSVVVVASVVVSVDVESAATDAASSDEFICAKRSPATAVKVAPAKKSAA